MAKFLRYAIIALFLLLVLWGIWSIIPQSDDVICIVLDAGHGGHDPGAVSGDIYEKDLNLAIMLSVQKHLNELLHDRKDIIVLATRTEDEYLTLSQRADFANQKHADLFVSIHANALENNTSYDGIITFFHPGKLYDQRIAKEIQAAVVTKTGGTDRGVRMENYAVLRETKMSAVLIETGFMTCPEELELLKCPDYQEKIALGIATGIMKSLKIQ